MLLQTVRPNIVQSIRAYRPDDLMTAAQAAGHHFLHANLVQVQSKQEVLDSVASSFLLPAHCSKSLDSLYDCMTDALHKSGPQPGFVVVLEQIPYNPRFDREAREQLLDVFRDAADFWAERKVAYRCFFSFAVPLASEINAWDRVNEQLQNPEKPAPKNVSKNGVNPNFGTNMPMMSSAFDTAMWLSAA